MRVSEVIDLLAHYREICGDVDLDVVEYDYGTDTHRMITDDFYLTEYVVEAKPRDAICIRIFQPSNE